MIFHPNPMIKYRHEYWHDQHLNKVVVKAVLINNSKNPKRYVVFVKTSTGSLVTSTRHITEEQAVVIAQRIANRLYKEYKRKMQTKKKV